MKTLYTVVLRTLGWLALFSVAVTAQAEIRDLGNGIVLDGQFTQGGLVIGQAPAGSKLRFQQRDLPLSNDGVFVFGFGRDDTSPQTLQVTLPGGQTHAHKLAVAARKFAVQSVTGVP